MIGYYFVGFVTSLCFSWNNYYTKDTKYYTKLHKGFLLTPQKKRIILSGLYPETILLAISDIFSLPIISFFLLIYKFFGVCLMVYDFS
jgi:hypothetical protein